MMNYNSNDLLRGMVEEICDRPELISFHPLPASVLECDRFYRYHRLLADRLKPAAIQTKCAYAHS